MVTARNGAHAASLSSMFAVRCCDLPLLKDVALHRGAGAGGYEQDRAGSRCAHLAHKVHMSQA